MLALSEIYTVGLVGVYAACALLGLAGNTPAEPWAPLGDEQTRTIEGILRRHSLLAEGALV